MSPHGMHEVQIRVLLVLHGPVQALLTRSWYGQTLWASLDFLEPTGCTSLFPHHNQNFLHLTCLAVLLRHTTAREPVDIHSTAPDHKVCAGICFGQPIYLSQLLVPRTDEEQLARGSACGFAWPNPGKWFYVALHPGHIRRGYSGAILHHYTICGLLLHAGGLRRARAPINHLRYHLRHGLPLLPVSTNIIEFRQRVSRSFWALIFILLYH